MDIKINFVTEKKPYWILGKWCEEWQKNIEGSTITHLKPKLDADVNIFVNYALHREGDYKSISVFTHREFETRSAKRFDEVAEASDWCIAQCENTANLLPKNKTSVIHPGIDPIFLDGTPIRLGIVGRVYGTGRKREGWLKDLYKLPGFEIWETYSEPMPFEKMPVFYKNIDYLLVIAENEGGPMPVKEALACGTPVIAPDIGWCWEHPVIKYDGTYKNLESVLKKIKINDDLWEVGSRKMLQIFEKICLLNSKS